MGGGGGGGRGGMLAVMEARVAVRTTFRFYSPPLSNQNMEYMGILLSYTQSRIQATSGRLNPKP